MRALRWPALVVLPCLVVAALLVPRSDDGDGDSVGFAEIASPVVADDDAAGATWYCPGATIEGSVDEHAIVLANTTTSPVPVRVTAYPLGGAPAVLELELPAETRQDVAMRELASVGSAAALVEVGGGGVAVQQEVGGDAGRAVAQCAAAPSDTWYFPSGATRPDEGLVLGLFNPFPADAVVDITFDTDDGTRAPASFQGLVVPGGAFSLVDVAATVTLREEVATSVQARSGRLVADLVQLAPDGAGASLVLGAPEPVERWWFPVGAGGGAVDEAYVIYNPNDEPAQVEVQVLLDDVARTGAPEPFVVDVGPRRYEVVKTFSDGRIPAGAGHAAVVTSRNGVGIVAQRSVQPAEGGAAVGIGSVVGSPVVATRWTAAAASFDGADVVRVVVLNPSTDTPVSVRFTVVGGGAADEVTELTVEPQLRRSIEIAPTEAPISLVVEADGGAVVELRVQFDDPTDFDDVVAAPTMSSLSRG